MRWEMATSTAVSSTVWYDTYMIGGNLHKGDVNIDDLRKAIKSVAAG